MGDQTLRSLLQWGHDASHRGGNYRANFIWDCVSLNDSPEIVAAAKAVQEADKVASDKYDELLKALENKANQEDPRLRVVELLKELEKIHEVYGDTAWIHVGLPALFLERLVALPTLDPEIAAKVSYFIEQLRSYNESHGKEKSDGPRLAILQAVAVLKSTISSSLT